MCGRLFSSVVFFSHFVFFSHPLFVPSVVLAMKAYAYSLRSGSYQLRRVFWGLVDFSERPRSRERADTMQRYNGHAHVHVHRIASFQSTSTKLSVSCLPFLVAVFNFAQACSCPSRHPCLYRPEPWSACAPSLQEAARGEMRRVWQRWRPRFCTRARHLCSSLLPRVGDAVCNGRDL